MSSINVDSLLEKLSIAGYGTIEIKISFGGIAGHSTNLTAVAEQQPEGDEPPSDLQVDRESLPSAGEIWPKRGGPDPWVKKAIYNCLIARKHAVRLSTLKEEVWAFQDGDVPTEKSVRNSIERTSEDLQRYGLNWIIEQDAQGIGKDREVWIALKKI